jgi:thiol:disulfide interchange protein/DsbC/DsbD-like thiol-disulfide interchange protein
MKRALLIATVLLFTQGVTGQTVKSPSTSQRHHTRVELRADVAGIQPGVPFTVGVLMKMDEGWHTYWQNSGEAGLPTRVEWTLPEGFAASEIAWPLPHKYNESGDVLTYGYEDETMLLVQITPPAVLRAGTSVTVKAKVSWLECEKLCVPGSADVALTLPVTREKPRQANEALFAHYRALVPRPLAAQPGFSLKTEAKNSTIVIELQVEGDKQFVVQNDVAPDFYPHAHDSLTFGRTAVRATPTGATLSVPVSAFENISGPLTVSGVLLYQFSGGERQAAVISIPLSREFCSGIKLEGEASTPAREGLLDQTFTTVQTAHTEQPLILYILFAVIGGVVLNIMPCVLPVIGLKIFGLMRMAGHEPARVRRLGWFFSFGILASFLVLALLVIILKAAGEQVGWGFQFQEPLFVIAMCTIVFAFGLSLFGVFEINVPLVGALANAGATEERNSGQGYLSSFSEGVFATILATPCTAPFLGSAMGFAFSQPAHVILLLFASVAFGMALPYLVLTTKPNWMKFMPKPGEWMVTTKQFMGFLMMATLVWLLHVLGSQLGMEAVIWTAAFLLFVGFACWLVGRFATLTASRVRYFTTWTAAVLVVALGFFLFIGDVLKARDILSNTSVDKTSAPAGETDGIAWQPFSLEQLESHLKANRTVFLDFTAEWCLTCKVNEKTVLADKAVVEAFKKNNVVPMKADWTNGDATITRLLQKFGRSGVPLYVVFPAGKPHEPIVLPEVITTGIVLSAIEKASGVISAQ